jgi:hypothetical protein
MRLLVFISLCLSLAILSLSAKSKKFLQTRDLPPLKLAAADLDTILRKTQGLITAANGPVPEQDVESISKSLENDLRRYSTKVGGATFRRVVGVCLYLGLLTSVGLSGAYWWRTRACDALGMLICSAIGLSLVLLVPWRNTFPASHFTRATPLSF